MRCCHRTASMKLWTVSLLVVGFDGLNASTALPCRGGVLFRSRRFLRWCRRLPLRTPARGRPGLNQLIRDVMVLIMLTPGANIFPPHRVEFRLPPVFQLDALRFGEHAGGPPQGATLHGVSWTRTVPLEFIKAGRPSAVAAPPGHNLGTVRPPRLHQCLAAVEVTAGRIWAQPKLHQRPGRQLASDGPQLKIPAMRAVRAAALQQRSLDPAELDRRG